MIRPDRSPRSNRQNGSQACKYEYGYSYSAWQFRLQPGLPKRELPNMPVQYPNIRAPQLYHVTGQVVIWSVPDVSEGQFRFERSIMMGECMSLSEHFRTSWGGLVIQWMPRSIGPGNLLSFQSEPRLMKGVGASESFSKLCSTDVIRPPSSIRVVSPWGSPACARFLLALGFKIIARMRTPRSKTTTQE